jgi:hypothetical protein
MRRFHPRTEQKVNYFSHNALSWRTDVEVTVMADGRNGNLAVRSVERSAPLARTRAGSASRVNERLIEQLCQLGREVIDEPVPQQLIDVVRARKAGRRSEQPSPGPDRSEPSL